MTLSPAYISSFQHIFVLFPFSNIFCNSGSPVRPLQLNASGYRYVNDVHLTFCSASQTLLKKFRQLITPGFLFFILIKCIDFPAKQFVPEYADALHWTDGIAICTVLPPLLTARNHYFTAVLWNYNSCKKNYVRKHPWSICLHQQFCFTLLRYEKNIL